MKQTHDELESLRPEQQNDDDDRRTGQTAWRTAENKTGWKGGNESDWLSKWESG